MARFGGRNRDYDREDSGGRGSDRGESRRSAYRGGRGNRGGRSYGGRGNREDSGFTLVGSVTTKKGTPERVVEDLRNEKLGLWWQVYLPEGVKSLTLRAGQRVYIGLGSFSRKAPDFVVGSVSLPPDEDGDDDRDGGDRD